MKKRLRSILSRTLRAEDVAHISNSYDIIGDISIIRISEKSMRNIHIIAEAIMGEHKNVKTVLAQRSPVRGEHRVRVLTFVAGEDRTTTIHKESECLFSVDIARCYFSPRLLYERMRIAEQVGCGEVLVNMFAGVGCFSIIAASRSKPRKVYSIDVNPTAYDFMRENVRRNRLVGKVVPMKGDAKVIVEKKLRHVADRVLMPLPKKALEYLPYALGALKNDGGWIHYYDFVHAEKSENPVEKAELRVARRFEDLDANFSVSFGRVVRTTGPNWYQVVLDIDV
ncbi:class I SAM-dependent methyltransferase family protein [Candidatus Bathyarchaeota archaeon]|nr:class I SAM-dependent methyltransferase family protein [Candidatus Bathyarchaeota archaeon]